ncbi:MAG: HNH endonuclease [Spirochaetales bacterium]|nr:HNH endonuclease [Spirochaetales bacterium]MCP5484479.1 HNH endonuclease [Spirochaetales bacterium]
MERLLYDPVLVLNAGMVPIEICTVRKAVLDLFREIAVAVSSTDKVLRSPSVSIAVPRIISRLRYNKVPRRDVSLTKYNVMLRDDLTCAYCEERLPPHDLTVDHVVPRSRWRRMMGDNPGVSFNSWENLVTACKRCNFRKGDRTLAELGWKLRSKPIRPAWMPQLVIARDHAEQMGWLDYCQFNVRLIDRLPN